MIFSLYFCSDFACIKIAIAALAAILTSEEILPACIVPVVIQAYQIKNVTIFGLRKTILSHVMIISYDNN
jgi:hypothetical protein